MPRRNLTIALGVIAAILSAETILLWRPIIFPIIASAMLIHTMEAQMSAGRHYMDSLKPNDFPTWIERSQQLQKDAPPGNFTGTTYGAGSNAPIPEDLKKLKILRIDMFENTVSYVWCGGMDHCELIVEKQSNGAYQVTAQYDDDHSRVLWPQP